MTGFSMFKKNWYLQIIVSAKDHTEAHVYDTQYHWHLHLIGVQKCQTIGGQVPNLYSWKGTKTIIKYTIFIILNVYFTKE